MRPRITLGRFLIRLGKFVQSLAVMVMRPDDLVEFGRQMYTRPHNVASWGRPELVYRGLGLNETALLEHLPLKQGRLLLLGVGGGREAIPLAQMGFDVTGVDFVPGMVEKARENAAQRGVRIEGLVQEISKLDVPDGAYDVVWLCAAMYLLRAHPEQARGDAAAHPTGPAAGRPFRLPVPLGHAVPTFPQSGTGPAARGNSHPGQPLLRAG